jgi:hypothetical protein
VAITTIENHLGCELCHGANSVRKHHYTLQDQPFCQEQSWYGCLSWHPTCEAREPPRSILPTTPTTGSHYGVQTAVTARNGSSNIGTGAKCGWSKRSFIHQARSSTCRFASSTRICSETSTNTRTRTKAGTSTRTRIWTDTTTGTRTGTRTWARVRARARTWRRTRTGIRTGTGTHGRIRNTKK